MPQKRVIVYLRESVPFAARERVTAVVGRLQSMEDAGVVDEVTIETWANRVVDEPPTAVAALTAYEGLSDWATEHGHSLGPGFDAHDCHCGYTHETFRTTVFPVICLAVYEDDHIVAVYPHSGPGTHATVDDGLAMLEAGRDGTVADAELDGPEPVTREPE